MTETARPISLGFRRLAAASAFAGLFAFALTVTVTPSALNQIKHLYHKTDAQVGWVFPLSMAGFFACVLLGGHYSDERGKLPVILLGCTMMAVGSFLFAGASTYPVALAAMLVMGCGGGFAEGIAMAIVADVFAPDRRTSMMNCAQIFFAAGAVMGPLFVSWLLAAGPNWKWAYTATAGACVIAALISLAAAAKREERPLTHEENDGDWKTLIKDRSVLVLAFGILLYVSAEAGQAGWLAPYFRDSLGASKPAAAATVALFWSGIGLGRLTATWTSRHLSDYAIICLSLAFAAICQTALLIFSTPIPAMIMLPLLGFGLAPVWPTIVSSASAVHPRQSGAVLGIVVAAGAIGAGVVPPAIGLAADIIGLRHALWVCVALLVVNLAMFVVLWRRRPAR